MASVFVSYAREDAVKARVIAAALEHSGFDVWFDERIHSGSEYSREIESALKDATAVVVLWSQASIDSAWVRDEAAEGRDSGRLVPVILDGSRPPIGFRQFQTTDFSRWSGRGKPKEFHDLLAAVGAKTSSASVPSQPTPGRRLAYRRVGWAIGLVALIIVAVGVILFVTTRKPSAQQPSLAILPFTADSSDPDARRLAAATRDSMAHTLSQGAFAVSAMDTPPSGSAPADYQIFGQVTGTPAKFVATVRMEETAHHYVVFSHQFETSRGKTENFAELVGAQVAAQLSWTAPMLAIERRHPSDPSIVASLLQSSVAGMGSIGALHDYETSRRIAAQEPDSPLAQNTFAINTAFVLDQLPREDRTDALAAARRAAQRMIEIAPEFGGAGILWCLLRSEQRMVQCEDHLRGGMRANPDGAFDNFFLSRLLLSVGRTHEAASLASLSLGHDPYMPLKIANVLRMLEATGQTAEAADLYHRSKIWWPDNEAIIWNRESGMILRGDFQAMERFDGEVNGQDKPNPVISALNRGSLPALRTACTTAKDIEQVVCMLGLARLGDLNAAYALADRLYPSRRGRTAAEEERIWLDEPSPWTTMFLTTPAAAPLRGDPRYVALAERVGLLEYWRSGRLPDFCTAGHEPICAKLRRG